MSDVCINIHEILARNEARDAAFEENVSEKVNLIYEHLVPVQAAPGEPWSDAQRRRQTRRIGQKLLAVLTYGGSALGLAHSVVQGLDLKKPLEDSQKLGLFIASGVSGALAGGLGAFLRWKRLPAATRHFFGSWTNRFLFALYLKLAMASIGLTIVAGVTPEGRLPMALGILSAAVFFMFQGTVLFLQP